MATHHVQLRSGKVVEIRANTPEEAQRLGDERGHEFPEVLGYTKENNGRILKLQRGGLVLASEGYSTSDPEKVKMAMEGMQPFELSQSMVRQGVLQEAGPIVPRIMAATEAVGFGAGSFVDEIADYLGGKKTGEVIRAITEAQKAERPLETLGLQLGVGAAEGYTLAKRFPQLAQMLTGRRGDLLGSAMTGAAVGAGTGLVGGAISGAGQAMPDESRLEKGLQGGLFGAAVGGPLGAAVPVASAGGRNVMEVLRRSEVPAIAAALRISNKAAEVIKSTFMAGQDIDQAIANIQRAGDEGMLADAGSAAQVLLDLSATQSGQASQTARSAISQRAERVSGGLRDTLDTTLGADELSPRQAVNLISERTKDARSEAYRTAYSNPVDYGSDAGREIEGVLARIPARDKAAAFQEANDEMLADGIANQQMRIQMDAQGNILEVTQDPNTVQLDYLKRALNNLAERDQFGRLTAKGRRYANLASDLRGAMGNAIEGYNRAARLGGEKIAEENAFMLGRDALKPNAELGDILDELGPNPSQAQIDAAKLGMRNYIRNVLDSVKGVPSDMDVAARQLDQFYRLTSSDKARKTIRSILGPAEANELFKEIDKVGQTSQVRQSLALNAKTAQRLAAGESVDELLGAGMYGKLIRGEPVAAARDAIKAMTGATAEMDAERKRALYDEIARAMTETRGNEAQRVMRILDDAMQGRRVTQAENDELVRTVATVLSVMANRELRGKAQDKVAQ